LNLLLDHLSREAAVPACGLFFVPLVPWIARRLLSSRLPARRPAKLEHLSLIVTNPHLAGKRLEQLAGFGVVVSRRKRNGHVEVARRSDLIRLGDILLAVGLREELEDFRLFVGRVSREDLRASKSRVVMRRVAVTKIPALGRKLGTMKILNSGEVRVTRLVRSRSEFLATPDQRLRRGHILFLVGYSESVAEVAATLGRIPPLAR
jgi:uncharacterized transporter YbjL